MKYDSDMPKSWSRKHFSNFACSLFLLVGILPAAPLQAQAAATEASSSSTLPTDPKELLQLATKSNGLTGEGMQPWHLKASFKLFDIKGNDLDQGTLEEFWAGQKKYKRVVTTGKYSQSEFGTEKNILRTGSHQALPTNLALIYRDLIAPFPLPIALTTQLNVSLEMRETGNLHLLCLSIPDMSSGDSSMLKANFCLDSKLPFVRISQYPASMTENPIGNSQFIHSNVVRFQGQYLARDIQAFENSSPEASPRLTMALHVESVEKLSSVDEATFAVPADAQPVPTLVSVEEPVVTALLLNHPKPLYPPIAVAAKVSGTVVLKARIDSNGNVARLGVRSGPPMLLAAALDAVKKWTFRPYLLNGQPAEVDTTITLIFRLDPPLVYGLGDSRNPLR